jgi:peptidoglycan/LPS O-acetylase OafA/YrhL
VPLSGLLAAAGVAALIVSAKTDHFPLIRSVAVPYFSVWLALAQLPGLAGWGRFGDFSYGLYLFAFPVQQAAVRFAGTGIGPAGVLAAGYPVALLLAWLSWTLVERPALSLKARRAGGPAGPS